MESKKEKMLPKKKLDRYMCSAVVNFVFYVLNFSREN